MIPASLTQYAALHGAVLLALVASIATAQNQTWSRQLGTSSWDSGDAAVPDGSGGVFVIGWTDESLGGQNAGGFDAWLARYDYAGNQSWIRQFGSIGNDFARAAAPDSLGGVYLRVCP